MTFELWVLTQQSPAINQDKSQVSQWLEQSVYVKSPDHMAETLRLMTL